MGKNTTKRSLLASVIIYKKDDPLGVIFFGVWPVGAASNPCNHHTSML